MLVPLLLLLLFLCCVKGIHSCRPDFSRDCSSLLKGFLVLLVIWHHMPLAEWHTHTFGKYAVALFFFMSGYGLMHGRMRQGASYLSGFFFRRLTKLLLPYVVAWLVYAAIEHESLSWQLFANHWKTGETLVPYGYFVEELCLFYLVFYCSVREKGGVRSVVIVCISTVCMMATWIAMGWNTHWWISSLAFPVGMAACLAEPLIASRSRTWLMGAFVVVLLVVCGIAAVKAAGGFFILAYAACFTIPACCLGVFIALPFIRVHPYAPLPIIGGISYETYIYQGLVLSIAGRAGLFHSAWGPAVVLAGCLIVGYGLHLFDRLLLTMLKRRRAPSIPRHGH